MVKNGKVLQGKTPSVLSGEKSGLVKSGEAVASSEKDEEVRTFDELVNIMSDNCLKDGAYE